MVAGAVIKGEVVLNNVIVEHLKPIISKLRESGCLIFEGNKSLRLKAQKIEGCRND